MTELKVYFAARYDRHPEMRVKAYELSTIGVRVTSRWIMGNHESDDPKERVRFAGEDMDDINAVGPEGFLIAFTEEPNPEGRNRGGRHVEFGYALGIGIGVIVVGPAENVFYEEDSYPFASRFDTWEEAKLHLEWYTTATGGIEFEDWKKAKEAGA